VLAIALFVVLAIILLAALWPFDFFPHNDVAWLKGRNGLDFGRNPVVLSRAPFHFADPSWSSISLEIWTQPTGHWRESTFLSFYTPENPQQFRMMYFNNVFLIRRARMDAKGQWHDNAIGVDNAAFPGTPLFITITAGPQGTSIYLNGKLAERSSNYILTGRDFSGQLIFGTSPFEKQTWHGAWRGLAICGAELSQSDVAAHFQKWTGGRQKELLHESVPTALYDFHEGTGDTAHDLAGVAPDLFIPKHYSVPHKAILEWPWKEFHPTRSYAVDVAVNIAGFIPFGFLLTALLWSTTRNHRPVLTAILAGAFLSLTIELLQGYIPQRASGMTDVITNTLGTATGAIICGQRNVLLLFAKWFGLTRPD